MKRRSFIKGLIGSIVAVPVVAAIKDDSVDLMNTEFVADDPELWCDLGEASLENVLMEYSNERDSRGLLMHSRSDMNRFTEKLAKPIAGSSSYYPVNKVY